MGCAIATTICLILGSGVSINWYYYHIGLNLNLFFKNILQLIKPIVLACVLIAAGIHFAPLKHAWISFVWHGIGLTMIYVYCLWLFGFNTYEKNLFLNPLKKIHRKYLQYQKNNLYLRCGTVYLIARSAQCNYATNHFLIKT